MRPAIAANAAHLVYAYCRDDNDPDSLCAFQVYASAEDGQRFLQTEAYATYLRAVEPLLAKAPDVVALTPLWSKGI